jgi:uncharacterized iron-regulated protein
VGGVVGGPGPARLVALLLPLLVACSTAVREPAVLPASWQVQAGRDHPLVGRVFEVATGRFVSGSQLISALVTADLVLHGEQHDVADHHRVQANLIDALVLEGRRPAVAFEQVDLERQAEVDAVLGAGEGEGAGALAEADAAAKEPADADASVNARADAAASATAIAEAVEWQATGWPPFDEYRPVFESALRTGLPIRAANLSRVRLREAMREVHAAAPAGEDASLPSPADRATGVPLPAAQRARMEEEIRASHCGHAGTAMVAMMLHGQRLRDAAMAEALLAAYEASVRGVASMQGAAGGALRPGAVLIAGHGHVRRDTGVPLYLRAKAPALRTLAVALLGVRNGATQPADYASLLGAAGLPFDYVVFTPRADDEDPCEKFREQLERMRTRPTGS